MANTKFKTIKLDLTLPDAAELAQKTDEFYDSMRSRRTIRDFSDRPVPLGVIKTCIQTAGTAPSGANRQPWHFAVVSNPAIKKEIRLGAEQEEREFYNERAPQDWLDALAPLGTNDQKPFLEIAPYLIVIFGEKFSIASDGSKLKNYYVTESASIATGLLIAALHRAGLATLTHTPSPMKFLNRILQRPTTEKPLLVLVTGYPATEVRVPDITRKQLHEIASFH